MKTLTVPFEIKSLDDAGHLEGIVSAYGKVDSYGDTIVRGAYSSSLTSLKASGRALPLLYHHDPHRPIGVWTDLSERDVGLYGKAKLTMATRDAQEAHALAKDGALTGISIGYNVPTGGSIFNGKVRELHAVDLVEASLVTFPADSHARIASVKAIGGAGDIADLLREAGMSGRQAKAAAGAAWKAINDQNNEDAADAELAAVLAASAKRLGF